MAPVHRIVLTGGPCGGKTTALARVAERLRSLGFRVFLVPETPTMLFTGGATYVGAPIDQIMVLESHVLRVQMATEDAFVAIARATGEPSVVLYDRGCMDVSAYLPTELWQALLDEHDWTPVGLRDRRYDAVLHLVTAADGAEAFYTTENNTTRTETPEQARAVDHRIREAWLGHPHLRIIENRVDFADKIQGVVQAVCRVTGVPEPIEIERRFLVRSAPDVLPVRAEEVEIEQTYLAPTDGSEARIRRRGQRGSHTYTHTVKRPKKAGQRVEIERPITAREYVTLMADKDPTRETIRKRRTCFLWRGHYFELDRFVAPRPGLMLLEVELEDEGASVELPPFLEIEREVTGDATWGNHALARR